MNLRVTLVGKVKYNDVREPQRKRVFTGRISQQE